MTKSVDPPPTPEPPQPKGIRRLLRKLQPTPKKVTGGLLAIATLGGLGYWGTQTLVKKKLPPFLEAQIGKIIERPISLGEVKGLSLNSIKFGETVIPPTPTDPDRVTVEEVKVGFNVFPVLFRRTLPLDVSLVQPDIYLEQEEDGEWLNLDFLAKDPEKEDKDPLIYFDVDLDVEQADITAIPHQQEALQAQVDGSGRFNQKQAIAEYDLDAAIEQAKAKIQGETKLATGSTDTKLLVDGLALADAATLLPIPLTVERGILNADLDINIPSFAEITAANVQGKVNLQGLAGEATELDAPITAESQLNFAGRNAEVNQTQLTLGEITAQVNGQLDLDTGYDLDVNLLPFQLASLPNTIIQQLPVPIAGEVEALVKLRGEIKNPQLTGSLNSTQTVTVDRTPLQKVSADFRADLDKVVLADVQILPLAGGEVMAEGTIETNLRQTLDSQQQIDVTRMPLALSFNADLPTSELVNPYYQLPPQVAVGELQAQGQIDGTIANPQGRATFDILDPASNRENIAGSGELIVADRNIRLQDTTINYGEGEIDVIADANLDSKQWQANLNANTLNLRPFAAQFSNQNLNLDRPIAVKTAQANLNGTLDSLDLDQIDGTAQLDLNVNGGDVAVNSQLNSGNINAQARTSNIQLDPFLASLPVAASLQSGTIDASGKVEQLLAFKDNPSLNSLQADADLDLLVDGEAVTVDTQVNSGKIQAQANTNQIDLNRLAPALPIPANLRSGQLTADGDLEQLVNFADNPNLSSFTARVDADLEVAAGTTTAIANLNNNQWRASVEANNISSKLLLNEFVPSQYASLEVDNISTQAELSGSIQPLIKNEANLPIKVDRLTLNSGDQSLQAQGNLTLANITSNLDVADSNLKLDAKVDFDQLPIEGIVAGATQNNELIANSVNVRGQAAFQGQFLGQQLLSAPGEQLNLTGDLRLEDFAFNDISFDPVMSGTVDVQPEQEVALSLRGEQDVIAAKAVPCTTDDCKLPYLPTKLELRQGEDTTQPIVAVGERNGDRFALDINNFPLALLNLAPGQAAGIEGALAGTTTGSVDLDLYTLAATGEIVIDQPGVGYIQADQLNADFNYDPGSSLAEITSASLELDRSQYNLNAALDLATGKIDGKLDIPQAYVQDLLTTLRWFTIEDVVSLFNIPDYASTAAVKPAPQQDTVDRSIARKLNQLRLVNRQIQANAAAQEMAGVPTELDIRGKYVGEVILGGTIQVPQANFRVEGNSWQWQPRPAYPDLVNPLGLVIEESQFIALPKLLIEGDLNGTTVDLAEARLEVQEAALSLKGKLSAEESDATFAVANLTVDNIANFVEIPVDLTGEINSVGTIKGTPAQPNLAGKVAFSDGAFNGNILPAKLAGEFGYDGQKLGFNTTAPQSIDVEASLPYPIIPGKSDRLTASANLKSEAFVFLAALSQNYLNWTGGDGDAQLEASARLDLEREGVIYDLAVEGVVNLNDANVLVETPFFAETFNGTGKITLDNQIVNVETLDATFAEKDLSIAGKLPILTAVADLDSPLTISLPEEGDIKIQKLYQGGVKGNVTVTGASLQPVIGGEVALESGRVSIPKVESPTPEDAVQIGKTKLTNSASGVKANQKAQPSKPAKSSSFVTALNNLQIKLKDFQLKQAPLYSFEIDGGLTLNGTVDKPSNILPQGKLQLKKADVDLFRTSFDLVRRRENIIVFRPEAGVFNPRLDVILQTSVEDIDTSPRSLSVAESNANEIDDPLAIGGDSDTVRINLAIDGEASDILPNLGQQTSLNCNIRPANQPLVENKQYYTEAELQSFTSCFQNNFSVTTSDRSLIDSSAVALTSTPNLNEGAIISLLSNQLTSQLASLTDGGGIPSQEELFDLGVNTFVLTPLRNRAFSFIDDTTIDAGKKIGLDYLSVFPNFEGVYELDEDSSIRPSYNYVLNEARIEYQKNF
ncbi:MAG: translocation/assembly module TamB domain-containing protein [Cyanobacteria bacterium J06600_6]